MNILYVTEWFATPDTPGLSRAYQFARAWTEAGHHVTVLTGDVDHLSNRPSEPVGKLGLEVIDGVHVVRLRSVSGWPGSIAQRAMLYGSFAWSAYRAARGVRSPDIVVGSTPPPTVGLVAGRIAQRFGVPFAYEMRDLWPDRLIAAGQLRHGPLARWITAMERACLQRAAGAVFVTRGDALVARQALGFHGRSIVIPHGVDHWMSAPVTAHARRADQPFTCVYVGAHGPYNRLPDILAAAHSLRDEAFRFVFIGDGDDKSAIAERAREWRLDRVEFRPLASKRDAFAAMCHADACLLASGPDRHYRRWLPNKVFDYLASGTPVVASAHGELAELVERAGGIVVPARQPAGIMHALRALHATPPARRRALGARARDYVLRHHRRTDRAHLELAWLRDIIAGYGSSGSVRSHPWDRREGAPTHIQSVPQPARRSTEWRQTG